MQPRQQLHRRGKHVLHMPQRVVNEAARPTLALHTEGPHKFRQLRQGKYILQKDIPPRPQLRPVPHVHIFRNRVGTDAAYIVYAPPAPDTRAARQRGHEAVLGKPRRYIFFMPSFHSLKMR